MRAPSSSLLLLVLAGGPACSSVLGVDFDDAHPRGAPSGGGSGSGEGSTASPDGTCADPKACLPGGFVGDEPRLSAGDHHTCAIRSDGTVSC